MKRPANMCEKCLYGKHKECAGEGCTCIHRNFTAADFDLWMMAKSLAQPLPDAPHSTIQ